VPSADTSPTKPVSVRVWDTPIRLFHWLLVALLGFSWWSGKQHDMEWHRLSGYSIFALLIFRIYWGVVGARTARFAQFVRGPRALLAYARSLTGDGYAPKPGHNPIGGWSVVLILATLATMVIAGLFSVDVDGLESGPLADYVSFEQGRLAAAIHHFVFNFLLLLVALHVLAVLFYLARLGQNLIGPMITGRRRAGDGEPIEELGGSAWKALLGVALAGLILFVTVRGFRL